MPRTLDCQPEIVRRILAAWTPSLRSHIQLDTRYQSMHGKLEQIKNTQLLDHKTEFRLRLRLALRFVRQSVGITLGNRSAARPQTGRRHDRTPEARSPLLYSREWPQNLICNSHGQVLQIRPCAPRHVQIWHTL